MASTTRSLGRAPRLCLCRQWNKKTDLLRKPIKDVAMDTSHSHRFPLWLTSLAGAYPVGSDERAFYEELLMGLGEQFVREVLVGPTDDFPSYRTANFMDGRNGVYRWNYATQGPNNGYGPYELSGTLCLGWWTFLGTPEVKEMYATMAELSPLPNDVLDVCMGPGTTRKRYWLLNGSRPYVNGCAQLISILASTI